MQCADAMICFLRSRCGVALGVMTEADKPSTGHPPTCPQQARTMSGARTHNILKIKEKIRGASVGDGSSLSCKVLCHPTKRMQADELNYNGSRHSMVR